MAWHSASKTRVYALVTRPSRLAWSGAAKLAMAVLGPSRTAAPPHDCNGNRGRADMGQSATTSGNDVNDPTGPRRPTCFAPRDYLFEHLVGEGEQSRWNVDPECSGRL